MIVLKNLSVGYGNTPVLTGAELEFRPGEVTVILGPNGSGKSTLLRTVLGLQPALGGEVYIDGADTRTLTPREVARKLCYLAQFRAVPNITVQRLVLHGRFPHMGYPRRYRPRDYEAARRAMERAGVAELAHRPLTTLSGGQRQRVYLAMALAQDTPYLLFDEPTTYLDVGHQLELMDTAAALAREGRGVVLVLHDLCLALRCAHRLVVLDGGRVAAQGSPEELFQRGVLDEIFGVKLCRLACESGFRYYYR